MRRGGRERGSVGGGLKRPGCGHKGGKPARGGGERKPGPAPPGEPRAVAGTFLNAPNTQPGKRELEKEEEGREGGKKKNLHEPGKSKRPPPTCGSPNWSLTLPGQPTAKVAAPGPAPRRSVQRGSPGRSQPLRPPLLGERGRAREGGRSRLSPFPCRAVGQAGGAVPRQGKKSSLSGNGVFSAVNF